MDFRALRAQKQQDRVRANMKHNSDLLDTLLELQALDRVPRFGYSMRGISDPESVSEHTFHLCMLVWALAPEAPGVDLGHALQLAMIHDLAEVRTGDLPRTATAYFPRETKLRAERAVIEDLMGPAADRARPLLEEYQAGKTAEARFVGACDKLQLLLKTWTYEHWGAGKNLDELWENLDPFPDGGFDVVHRLFQTLRERRQRQAEEPRPA